MSSANKVTIIVNPIAGIGAGSSFERGRDRADLATAFLAKYKQLGQVFVTEGQGHAKKLPHQDQCTSTLTESRLSEVP